MEADMNPSNSEETEPRADRMDRIVFHHDTVLSDVHLLVPNTRHLMIRLNGVGQPVFMSKFRILSDTERRDVTGAEETTPGEEGRVELLLDEDGDIDVTQRPKTRGRREREPVCPVILQRCSSVLGEDGDSDDDEDDVIRIEHTMATPLEDVGKQVWRGAFLLADYILSNPAAFAGKTVLELGAGAGLTGIVMATVAQTVYSTDVGEDLLSMCSRNVTLNRHLMLRSGGEVRVRTLDWLRCDLRASAEDAFSWSEEEEADMYDNTSVIIAADVCYDDELTDGFFRTLYRLCEHFSRRCTVLIAIEKRMNFTLRHLDVSCEAYDHFRRCLTQLQDLKDGRCSFSVDPITCDFPQFLLYERIEHLELWKVTVEPALPVTVPVPADTVPLPADTDPVL